MDGTEMSPAPNEAKAPSHERIPDDTVGEQTYR